MLPPARHAAINQGGVVLQADVRTKAQTLHDARTISLKKDVGLPGKSQAGFDGRLLFKVEGGGAPSARQHFGCTASTRSGAVDPDHIGAKIAQQHGAEWRRPKTNKFHDFNAPQRALCFAVSNHSTVQIIMNSGKQVVALNRQGHNALRTSRGGIMARAMTIIVAGEADGAGELVSGLRGLGLSVIAATPQEARSAAIEHKADALVSLVSLAGEGRSGPVHIAVGNHAASDADARLQTHAHPIQIAARLRALSRLSILERTARLRAADAMEAGAPPAQLPAQNNAASILFVGAPCPAFLRLKSALETAEAGVVAAFSTFNAFDYLHEQAFDAVVLNTEPDPDLAHTVCSAMRRNTRLYHTPAILLTRCEAYLAADEAFARGASDLLPFNADTETIRDRVLSLAKERKRRRRSKALLEACRAPSFLDQRTDLFASSFGRRHLSTLIGRISDGHRLSIVGLHASAPDEAGHLQISAALDQFASMLRHCVRAEDLAVRTAPGAFYLALPSTCPDEAGIVAARVAAIAECTAYEGSDPLRPFRLTVNANVIEAEPGQDAEFVISRALAMQAQAQATG